MGAPAMIAMLCLHLAIVVCRLVFFPPRSWSSIFNTKSVFPDVSVRMLEKEIAAEFLSCWKLQDGVFTARAWHVILGRKRFPLTPFLLFSCLHHQKEEPWRAMLIASAALLAHPRDSGTHAPSFDFFGGAGLQANKFEKSR